MKDKRINVLIDTYSAVSMFDEFFDVSDSRLLDKAFDEKIKLFIDVFELDVLGAIVPCKAVNGYTKAVCFEDNPNISIHVSQTSWEMHCFIYFSGAGLRRLKELYELKKGTEFHFYRTLYSAEEAGIRPSRCDVACDLIDCNVDFNDLFNRIQNNRVARFTTNSKSNGLRRISYPDRGYSIVGTANKIDTIYFGKRPNTLLRCYDKYAELEDKKKTTGLDTNDIKRFEGEFRKKDAVHLQKIFVEQTQIDDSINVAYSFLASALLNKFKISELDEKGNRIGYCKEFKLIEELLGSKDFLFVTYEKVDSELYKSVYYMQKSYLSLFQKIGLIYGEEALYDFFKFIHEQAESKVITNGTRSFVENNKDLLLENFDKTGIYPWRSNDSDNDIEYDII
ncbi:replication initiation factor domain-containing protein [Streptococcus marmotae]|uniref:replication initiation factor domain-containing protein n=1 Tax=Streptococcus marmotae TaxID=1825069 RepID=UPI00082A0B62|nr:replication initiation factor domain-containing protein [Streptococcus marmotae]